MVYIGIDLGTTYSCVSVIENGNPKAIHHDDGKNIVPSVVAYGAEILVGNPALNSNIDMSNVLYGTLDVSILEMIGNNVDVIAVTGDIHLGGQDVDGRIMKYALTEFKKGSSYDIYKRPRLIRKLRTQCREAKEFLSNNIEQTNILMEINDEVNLKVPLTKSQLNQLCSDLFTKAIRQVDLALNTAQMTSNDIDYVILVGGSARIPRIRELLTEKFGRDKIKLDLNPDEIVSHGAAIIANAIQISI
ncbi:hypothetical protein WR25_13502 [Diploscapter pachys]|uniref:Uncharacterized protein n=1 Tax=Diploscapter pachys TaxID=2018661 RepID=A0A2A2JVV1_9BILA|nr:hypothetical protein WR25_13502 [Diploscapter pachys]